MALSCGVVFPASMANFHAIPSTSASALSRQNPSLQLPASLLRALRSSPIYWRNPLWCPRFLISLISANDRTNRVKPCQHWSNHGQPGSSLRKPSPQSLMTLLIKSTPTCGQTLVKTLSLNSLKNFCSVLQISPKHFTTSQYKSCPVFRGTQLCFWVALQIWSGKWWKAWSAADFTIHRRPKKPELCMTFLLKPLRKT
jgi:hypothetical protein